MANKNEHESGSSQLCCYGFREFGHAVDLHSLSESVEGVRLKVLESSMGWRFEHPDRYNQEQEWQRLLTYGSVVTVRVTVETA